MISCDSDAVRGLLETLTARTTPNLTTTKTMESIRS